MPIIQEQKFKAKKLEEERKREFVYYTEKKIAYKFIPYACPQRFHKE